MVEPAGIAPAPSGLKIRCANCYTTAPDGARAGSCTPISAVAGQRAAVAPRAHKLNSAPAGFGRRLASSEIRWGAAFFPTSDQGPALVRTNWPPRRELHPYPLVRKTRILGC